MQTGKMIDLGESYEISESGQVHWRGLHLGHIAYIEDERVLTLWRRWLKA